MAVDAIAVRYGFGPFRSRFQGQLAEGVVGDENVLILKPMTFMNESGRSGRRRLVLQDTRRKDLGVP